MAYFIPATLQKRLLRYALSRLELLEIEALDLDKLDIAWGRRSTVELKDVALRKDVRILGSSFLCPSLIHYRDSPLYFNYLITLRYTLL